MFILALIRPMYCHRRNAVEGHNAFMRNVTLLRSKPCLKSPDIPAGLGEGAQDRYQPAYSSGCARFVRLGLRSAVLLSAFLLVFFTFKLSYSYAQEKVTYRAWKRSR